MNTVTRLFAKQSVAVLGVVLALLLSVNYIKDLVSALRFGSLVFVIAAMFGGMLSGFVMRGRIERPSVRGNMVYLIYSAMAAIMTWVPLCFAFYRTWFQDDFPVLPAVAGIAALGYAYMNFKINRMTPEEIQTVCARLSDLETPAD